MFKSLRKVRLPNQSGLTTLAEVLVTIFVLTIGILSCLLYFTNALNSAQLARDVTVGTTHAETILEEMKTRSNLTNITSTNWVSWASGAGLNTLPSETVSVTYANQSANPLQITTTVGWSRQVRAGQVSLTTELTK